MIVARSLCCVAVMFFAVVSKGATVEIPSNPLIAVSEAGKAYDTGDYAKAVSFYEGVLSKGIVNGTLLHNLGNAYYRLERFAEAIAAFRGAARFLPRDAEVSANLEYARKHRVDIIEDNKQPVEQLLFWSGWASLGEYLALSAIFFTVAFSWLLFRRRFSRMPMWVFVVCAAVAGLMLVTTAAKYFGWVDVPAGVIVASEVSVKSGNTDANVTLFVLHAGTELMLGEQRGEWLQILLADGRKGWVREEFLKRVASPSAF